MNPSSDCMNSFIHRKSIILLLLGLLLCVPIVTTAQEATEEPQSDPVVTTEAVEESTTVEETVAPTEQPIEETSAPTEEPVQETEQPATEAVVTEEATETETEVPTEEPVPTDGETIDAAESTEEVVTETTEEPTVEIVETETPDVTEAPETVVIEETPAEITSISEDFEAWTGDNWTVTDWSVAHVDESLALTSTVAGATAQVTSVDWTSYTIVVDIKVEAENSLSLDFDGYNLVFASDGSHQLMKDGEVVATPPVTEAATEVTEPTWHTVEVNKTDAATTILVDGIPQYGYQTDISPLGIFAFVAGGEQGVAIDNLMMTKVDTSDEQPTEVVATPTPETDTVVDAETTEEPVAESTEEPTLAEATEEPVAESTEESVLAEATEEPTVDEAVEVVEEPTYITTNLITEDFEGDLSAWTTSASIVEVAEGNHVLLMNTGGQLAPAVASPASNLVISGQANIITDADVAGSLTLALSETYTVEISTMGVTISNNGEVLAVAESAQAINTWFTFSIESTDSGISVSVNDVVVTEATGEFTLTGNYAFTTNTGLMLDNLSVDSLTVKEVNEPLATPAPEVASTEILDNLGGIAHDMMSAYFEGGDEAVVALLAESPDPQDESGRVLVNILTDNGYSGEAIAQLVTDAGGEVTRVYDKSLEAYVNANVLLAVGNHEGVRFVRDTTRAVSTGPTAPIGTSLGGPSWTEAFDLLSIEDWNDAGTVEDVADAGDIVGVGVKVGVIDTAFRNADTARGGNLACLADTNIQYQPPGSAGTLYDTTSTQPAVALEHGTQVVEIICDIAPGAGVYMYRADDPSSLEGALNAAMSGTMDVIVISLDLGVNTSPGDGTTGSSDDTVYALLEAAKDAGIVTIVAAGNSNQRTLNLMIPTGDSGADFTIDLGVTAGDQIKFGWNDFAENGIADIDATLSTSGGNNSGNSTMPYTNPLILTAPASDADATLTVTPSSLTETVYLQIQITPRLVSGESTILNTAQANENNVKFDFTSLAKDGGDASANDITDTTGSIGRPADSDDVISVGASCARTDAGPERWEFSSVGPRFDETGVPPTDDGVVTQDEAKPSIMSYSFVTTASAFAFPEAASMGENADGSLICTDGFGGTSAAAAHVAGMTALLMSNDGNTSFDALNVSNSTSAATFEAVRDYLQSHAVDLPLGAEADGFDFTYGAGLSILGAPSYNLDETVNILETPDLLPSTCSTVAYVGQANLGNSTINGAITSPYTSIAQALNAGDADCIVVMPGEYVTPIVVDADYSGLTGVGADDPLLVTGYDDVSRNDNGDVIFWLRGMSFEDPYEYGLGSPAPTYDRRAGLYFTDQASSVEFSGFTFAFARTFDAADPIDAQAVVVDGSSDVTVSNSQFGTISLNGREYPGWINRAATPIQVLNSAQNVRIENNIFNDNIANSTGYFPTVAVIDSGDGLDANDPLDDEPIVIIGNEIYNNQADHSQTSEWASILYSEGSSIDIINNAFYDNNAETIVKVATTNPNANQGIDPTHVRRARIVGNVFLNNQTSASQGLPGGLINARYAPMMYIINNTIVGNNVGVASPFGQLISRGNKNTNTSSSSNGGSNPSGWDFWEIHNNLIYANTFRELVGDTTSVAGGGSNCFRIPNDASETANGLYAFDYGFGVSFQVGDDTDDRFNQRGAQNNWIVDNSSAVMGDCSQAITAGKYTVDTPAYNNQNIIDSDLQPVDDRDADDNTSVDALPNDFIGSDPSPPVIDPTDWRYYALTQTYVNPEDSSLNEYSDGIDAGKTIWLEANADGDAGDPYMDGADVLEDIIGTARPLDVENWVINWATGTADEFDYNPSPSPVQGISSTVSGTYSDMYTLDIGAFEFSPLQFRTNEPDGSPDDYFDPLVPIEDGADPLLSSLEEDATATGGIVTLDLTTIVTGGFGEVSFSIAEQPNNYGTQCGPQYDNTKGLIVLDNIVYYCVPLNYYSDSDFVSFKIQASDEAGAVTIGEIRLTIDPVDDAPFPGDNSLAIGDETPETDQFEVVGTLGSDLTVRLRPYVRFENFFFSENSNPEFLVSDELMVDYPFEYQITGITDDESIIDVGGATEGSFTTSPLRSFTLSDANTGVAIITYDVRDANGNILYDNQLKIRSVSVIPTEGLFDDTSFVWNYSDGENSRFYTEREDYETTETPTSGDWQAIRQTGAINNTLHTTAVLNDTATFRFVGTGFTLYMRNGYSTGSNFALNIYDDDTAIFSSTESAEVWTPVAGSVVNELSVGADFKCTTQAPTDPADGQRLLHVLGEYTITCNGLSIRKHTVQVVNTGGGALAVDAFAIITDEGVFTDADPLPPGFYDIDNGILRNAFDTTTPEWTEVAGSGYTGGIAYSATSNVSDISFTITEASGFAIGSIYRNTPTSYEICVDDDKTLDPDEGVCQTIEDDFTGYPLGPIHHPFFGLDPNTDYTVTLKLDSTDEGMIFDNLVIFDEATLPLDTLSLGTSTVENTNIVFGEPFGDDWTDGGTVQFITPGRLAVGPFISFQIEDDINGFALNLDNYVPPPPCSDRDQRRGTCPPAPPSGLSALQICVNRGVQATATTDDTPNCILLETIIPPFDYETSAGNTGEVSKLPDGSLYIDESLFDGGLGSEDINTIEIFSLTPDQNIAFVSVQLLSNTLGLGAGTYESYTSGLYYLDYEPSDASYTEVEVDEEPTSFVNQPITQCFRERRGVCTDLRVVDTILQTIGVGDAVLVKMQGTGFAPILSPSGGSKVRACWISESEIASSTNATIAEEIQAEANLNGGCRVLENNGTNGIKHPIYGLPLDVYWVMIELLPSNIVNPVAMGFNGIQIVDNDWESLETLDTGTRHETSYDARSNDNMFSYVGTWTTIGDTQDTHSGTGYDFTQGDNGAGILFKTTGGNRVHIIRDLRTPQPQVCTGRGRRQTCVPGDPGFSDVTVCTAPTSNPSDKVCSIFSSAGNATQSILPITLPDTGEYLISMTTTGYAGFAIDAVEVLDTTSDEMIAGTYQEDSMLITYGNGLTPILKNTSFENTDLLDTTTGTWDWNTDSSVTASTSFERPFAGVWSAKVEADTDESLDSETFQLISGTRYTVLARVNVDTEDTTVDMDLIGSNPFETQTTQFTDKWELLRYTFIATSDETAQLTFSANHDNTIFFVDDVHIYRGTGTWNFVVGGLTDGRIAVSEGYGSTASFNFEGTGFMVKLSSDLSSAEAEVCYDTNADMSTANCFTYNDEQPQISNNGHSVVGLPSDDYYVTITQMDDGLTKYPGPPICQGSGRRQTCSPGAPANTPTIVPASVKLDYIQIFDNTPLPVLETGGYNEDGLSNNETGLQLFPQEEWTQFVGNQAPGFTGNSFYAVTDPNAIGSMMALRVANDEPTTIVLDINRVTPAANQLLACIDAIDGEMTFDGINFGVDSSNCLLTTQATSQTQLVFNKANLPLLDGLGTERLFTLQSLTKSSVFIDGYQVIEGTALTEGFYQDALGYSEVPGESVYTISNISGTEDVDDWSIFTAPQYNGNSALGTSIDGTTITFTFEGTGISLLPSTGQPVTICVDERRGTCRQFGVTTPPVGQISIELDTSLDGDLEDICDGSCVEEIGDFTNQEVYLGPITIAGLPYGTYTVTLTAELDPGEQVSFDAVEVYGTLQELGSLYDDAQTNVSGTQLLTFGPESVNWQAAEDASPNFLNNTYHQSFAAGASVSFSVGAEYDTQAILIYDGNPTLPPPVCTGEGRRQTCTGPSYAIPSSSSVEVCWSQIDDGTGFLTRSCETITNLNDGSVSRRVEAPTPGEYNVSITNNVNGEPLVIDAIQIIEDGIVTEGIYEEDFFSSPDNGTITTPVANFSASDGFVMQLDQGDYFSFVFDGIAFSTQIVESSTDYTICAYEGDTGDTNCDSGFDMIDNITGTSNNALSALTYAGFTDTVSLPDNTDGRWTIVIENNDTDPLFIDRIDVLGNNNNLFIDDTNTYEAGENELRYLPFSSWVENTSYKTNTPYNGNQFETTLPGAMAYFEFGSGTFGIEYVRQLQEFISAYQICVYERRGSCREFATIPAVPAYADANVCYGDIGDPDLNNVTCVPFSNDTASIFQFSSSTSSVDCTDGCWGYVEYGRDSVGNSRTTLDYIRLYDPDSPLLAGVYQENHPNISYSTTETSIAEPNANVGFYNQITGTNEEYVSFLFEGTGFSVRTLASPTAEDISLCVYDYTDDGSIPNVADILLNGDENCLRTYDQEFDDGTYVTRAVHGLNHEAQYLGIIKMTDDGNSLTTDLNIDEIKIFEQQWYVEDDLTNSTYLNQLMGGESYAIDYTTRDTDKYVQFVGDSWGTITQRIQTGCTGRRCSEPIFSTFTEDRGSGPGTTALFHTDNANAVNIDLFVNGTGDVQICAMPIQTSTLPYGIDLTQDVNCQTFTVTGRSNLSMNYNDSSTDEHVITVELLTPSITTQQVVCVNERRGTCRQFATQTSVSNPWMNIFQVDLYNILAGLSKGQYAQSFPGIQFDSNYALLIDETMETAEVDWETIGSATMFSVGLPFEGGWSRQVNANTGEGIQYVDIDDNGVDLEPNTTYTVIAHVLIAQSSVGDVTMQLFQNGSNLTELDGMELTKTTRNFWQTIRATFTTGADSSDYEDVLLRLVAEGGSTTFFVDKVTLNTGGQWEAVTSPLGPPICTGSRRRQTCVPGNPLFDLVGDNYYRSSTPGASFSFKVVGTGFEIGLFGGSRAGEVEVCYHPEADENDENCITYGQDDAANPANDTTNIFARSIVGLERDTYVVTVREIDDGYAHGVPGQSRFSSRTECVPSRRGCVNQQVFFYADAVIGVDYVTVFDDTDVVSAPVGGFNEDATNGSDEQYLNFYPEDKWKQFTGTSAYTDNSYYAPYNGPVESATPGPAAMVQVDVTSADELWTVIFQLGLQSTNVANSVLVCVDETNGVMTWDGTQYVLEDSDNCKIENGVAENGIVIVTANEIDALTEVGQHNISITSLSPVGLTQLVEVCVYERRGSCRQTGFVPQASPGYLRIDGFQTFEGEILSAGLYNEILPDPLLSFSGDLDQSADCDPSAGWCYTSNKTVQQQVCVSERRGQCTQTALQPVTTNPYLGGAAITNQSGATLNFTAQGSGFSIISDVYADGLDFRVCYKLNSNSASFPALGSVDETFALQGFDAEGQPIRINEGGILCENMTTDIDNWSEVMDRPLSVGAQYGFSFYGLPLANYDVQVMVTTPQAQIAPQELMTIDAIQVFSDMTEREPLVAGLTDNTDENIIYEPSVFWDQNTGGFGTYLSTDSTTTHAGSIAQFTIDGNSLVLYQTVGNMSNDIQICVVISNENIHCSVESERQTRIARQVTSFSQFGELVNTQVCVSFRRGTCRAFGTVQQLEYSPFTPVVFYGLGEDEEHRIITENRVNGRMFNLDAIQVID